MVRLRPSFTQHKLPVFAEKSNLTNKMSEF